MKKIIVISNTAFSVEKFRFHYLIRLSKIYNIEVYTPDAVLKKNYKKLRVNENLAKINVYFLIVFCGKFFGSPFHSFSKSLDVIQHNTLEII